MCCFTKQKKTSKDERLKGQSTPADNTSKPGAHEVGLEFSVSESCSASICENQIKYYLFNPSSYVMVMRPNHNHHHQQSTE